MRAALLWATPVAALICLGAFVTKAPKAGAQVASKQDEACVENRLPEPEVGPKGEPIWAVIPPKEKGGAYAAVCFAPGTSKEQMRKSMEILRQRIGLNGGTNSASDFFLGGSWSATRGTPLTIRWSFVPDGTVADGVASNLFAQMDSKFSTIGGRAKWISLFDAMFQRWGSVSSFHYQRISVTNDADDGAAWGQGGANNARGDMRIAMASIDGQWNILAYNYYPGNGVGGDMVIDSGEDWAGTSFPQLAENQHRFLRNTLTHEHGHGIGIAHVCPINETKLMEPFLTLAFDGPQHDDIRAAHHLYGDAVEPNNTSGVATDLGILAVPSTNSTFGDLPTNITGANPANTTRLSVEQTGALDWYRFTVNGPTKFTLTVNPAGTTYLNGVQNQNGSCTAGTNLNSLSIGDLQFAVFGPDGTTQLLNVNATAAGAAETGTVDLPTAGTYFFRVTTGSTHTNDAQMYSFTTQTQVLNLVSGVITLGDLVPAALVGKSITVDVLNPGTNTVAQTTNVSLGTGGAYSFTPTVANGNYDLRFRGGTWLGKRVNGVALGTGTSLNIALVNGDANQDNVISAKDHAAVNKAFGATSASANWNPLADLNGDGTVNATDYAIVKANLRARGQ